MVFLCTRWLLTRSPSFIDSQLQLEADAREVLPYVSQFCLFVVPPHSHFLPGLRFLLSASRATASNDFRMYNMQSSSRLTCPTIHSRRYLLLLLDRMSWRSCSCGAF
jgi:hypothetical protein